MSVFRCFLDHGFTIGIFLGRFVSKLVNLLPSEIHPKSRLNAAMHKVKENLTSTTNYFIRQEMINLVMGGNQRRSICLFSICFYALCKYLSIVRMGRSSQPTIWGMYKIQYFDTVRILGL